MASISNLDRIALALKSRALPSKPAGQVMRGGSAAAPDGAAAGKPRIDVGRFVIERARAIRPDDPRRRRRVFRVFLEGSLVEMFGDAALAEPGFCSTLDQVQSAMESDVELAHAMERTTDALLAMVEKGDASVDVLGRVFGGRSTRAI